MIIMLVLFVNQILIHIVNQKLNAILKNDTVILNALLQKKETSNYKKTKDYFLIVYYKIVNAKFNSKNLLNQIMNTKNWKALFIHFLDHDLKLNENQANLVVDEIKNKYK